ncbi:ABC transporter ATP-binding protein [Porphyromonas loveana]|uniref:Amino acid/amide ABC transporter ATP-binding protein 1 (HAAT family) n=1 Tax=Porphyromonas loveana TaxID=1884669 RepID=A0A2U1FKS5_9PORP|nr:ATP-binding cassette domain-containing protein [Porphyromonas loveana]PVZ12815.1 amino acid/amide ABC transporter ATP-binding protein 1 (HAAT family) [Porphyromonas loveana]
MQLSVSHIAKSFGQHQVLTDVSFELSGGKIDVLMGTNGSGKTTLLNIVSGFLPQDKGDVSFDGTRTNHLPAYRISRMGITRTFQDMRLIGKLSVLENVLLSFPAQQGERWWKTLLPNRKITQEQQKNLDQAMGILKTCFIDDIAGSKAAEISYGQQKLLNLACSMANDPQVLLLDEPVAGVNIAYRDKLAEVIRKLKTEGKALLIIEHNTDFIESIADRILFLNRGRVTAFDDYTSFKNNEEVKEAYI